MAPVSNIPDHEPLARPHPKDGLNWDGGASRELPANRGAGDASSAAGNEFAEGGRGEASGRNQQEQEKVAGKPGKPD